MSSNKPNRQGYAHLYVLVLIPLLALSIGVVKSLWLTIAILAVAGLAAYLISRPKRAE